MNLPDIIAIAAIALAVGGAVFYIVRSKRGGKKCIGCPYADGCPKSSCACTHTEKDNSAGEDGGEDQA